MKLIRLGALYEDIEMPLMGGLDETNVGQRQMKCGIVRCGVEEQELTAPKEPKETYCARCLQHDVVIALWVG